MLPGGDVVRVRLLAFTNRQDEWWSLGSQQLSGHHYPTGSTACGLLHPGNRDNLRETTASDKLFQLVVVVSINSKLVALLPQIIVSPEAWHCSLLSFRLCLETRRGSTVRGSALPLSRPLSDVRCTAVPSLRPPRLAWGRH